jgi:hypothetical protein
MFGRLCRLNLFKCFFFGERSEPMCFFLLLFFFLLCFFFSPRSFFFLSAFAVFARLKLNLCGVFLALALGAD